MKRFVDIFRRSSVWRNGFRMIWCPYISYAPAWLSGIGTRIECKLETKWKSVFCPKWSTGIETRLVFVTFSKVSGDVTRNEEQRVNNELEQNWPIYVSFSLEPLSEKCVLIGHRPVDLYWIDWIKRNPSKKQTPCFGNTVQVINFAGHKLDDFPWLVATDKIPLVYRIGRLR